MELTQHDKILALMIKFRGKKEWFKASDFMLQGLGVYFVGYEASARMSELVKKYPYIFETKTEGRFRYAKINFTMLEKQMHTLEPSERAIVEKELQQVEGRLF